MNNGILSEALPPNSEADGKVSKGSTFCEFNFDLVSQVDEWLCGMQGNDR